MTLPAMPFYSVQCKLTFVRVDVLRGVKVETKLGQSTSNMVVAAINPIEAERDARFVISQITERQIRTFPDSLNKAARALWDQRQSRLTFYLHNEPAVLYGAQP